MQQFQYFLFLSSLKHLNKLVKYRASAMHELNLTLNRALFIDVQ